jgi:hypothetical protein
MNKALAAAAADAASALIAGRLFVGMEARKLSQVQSRLFPLLTVEHDYAK